MRSERAPDTWTQAVTRRPGGQRSLWAGRSPTGAKDAGLSLVDRRPGRAARARRRALRRVDRLIIRAACAAVAVIGLAIVVAGIYPLAWVADVAGSLGLAGLFAAGGVTALVTGRRTRREAA